MTCHQTIVWIDCAEAHILRVQEGLRQEQVIFADGEGEAPSAPQVTDGLTPAVSTYFHHVARALDAADEILIVGPSTTKLDFARYMHKDDHAFDPRILGVEDIKLPGDTELAGFAKLYFKAREPAVLEMGEVTAPVDGSVAGRVCRD